MTGMFLATNSPQPPGVRLRIEVLEGDRGFVVEGVVAHARKVRGDMMRLTHPGMGVRFLGVDELVRELIPSIPGDAPGDTEEIPGTRSAPPAHVPPPPAAAAPPWPISEAPEPAAEGSQPAAPPAPPETPVRPAAPPIPRPTEGPGVFSVSFLGPADLVEVFQRDILQGGLFVSTRFPGRLQETVQIELHPPLPNVEPIQFRARVVQRFEPHEESLGANLLSGMGVEIQDLPAVLERLEPIVERMKG
jgi:hypothetical protein